MSDAAIATVCAAFVTVATSVVGFLVMWVKIKYAAERADEAATKAKVVEDKIDNNTELTRTGTTAATEHAIVAATAATAAKTLAESVDTKTDTIVKQTNGNVDVMKNMIVTMAERVSKLEDYNRESAHRVLNAINATHLKVAELVAVQTRAAVVMMPQAPSVAPLPAVKTESAQGGS